MSRQAKIIINGNQMSSLMKKFVGSGENVRHYESTSVSGHETESLSKVALTKKQSKPGILHNAETDEYYIRHISTLGVLGLVDVIYVNVRDGFYRTYDSTVDLIPSLDLNTQQLRSILEVFVDLPV